MNYQGYLLAAHPLRKETTFRRGTVLVVKHNDYHCWGLQINKPITDGLDIQTVMQNSDIVGDLNGPVYWGGPDRNNRISVLHSLDWVGPTTVEITDNLGLSNDVTVLSALNAGRGPHQYRVVLGHIKWAPGELEGEISGQDPWTVEDTWVYTACTPNLIFDADGSAQWRQVMNACTLDQVNQWFS